MQQPATAGSAACGARAALPADQLPAPPSASTCHHLPTLTPSKSRYLAAASARLGTAIATWFRRPTLGGGAAAAAVAAVLERCRAAYSVSGSWYGVK